jgi:hypothetical protein
LTLDLSQVFPGGLNLLAAGAIGGIVRPLDVRRVRSSAETDAGASQTGASRVGTSSFETADPDLAYPGGFGSFMASMGGAMATEGRGAIEAGTFTPLELKAAPVRVKKALPEESRPLRGFRASQGFSTESSPLPSVPFALLSYALLPLFLAGQQLRSRI